MRVEGTINGNPDDIELYCDCGAMLVDGNFVLIDGTLRCLACHEKLSTGVIFNAPTQRTQ